MPAPARASPGAYSPRRRHRRRLVRRIALAGAIAVAAAAGILADYAGLFGQASQPDAQRYHDRAFRVVRVIDGDTLDVDSPDVRLGYATTRVRLLGVDAPETVKPGSPVEHFGPEASAYLRALAEGRQVVLQLDRARTRDIYDRLLAYVIAPDGDNLNERIIATGHGYADPRFHHPLLRRFQQAQTQARKARRGLWEDATNEDLPRYYRDKLPLPSAASVPATVRRRGLVLRSLGEGGSGIAQRRRRGSPIENDEPPAGQAAGGTGTIPSARTRPVG